MSIDEAALVKAHGRVVNLFGHYVTEEYLREAIEAYEAAKATGYNLLPVPEQPVDCRAVFESYAKRIGFDIRRDPGEMYFDHDVENRWQGWQAALTPAWNTKRESGWQPIETAPKDGLILVWGGSLHDSEIARVREGEFRIFDGSRCLPSHWMPLPKPPINEIEVQEGK